MFFSFLKLEKLNRSYLKTKLLNSRMHLNVCFLCVWFRGEETKLILYSEMYLNWKQFTMLTTTAAEMDTHKKPSDFQRISSLNFFVKLVFSWANISFFCECVSTLVFSIYFNIKTEIKFNQSIKPKLFAQSKYTSSSYYCEQKEKPILCVMMVYASL